MSKGPRLLRMAESSEASSPMIDGRCAKILDLGKTKLLR